MADLDADLYGDLYGNDDGGDFHDPSADENGNFGEAESTGATSTTKATPAPAVGDSKPAPIPSFDDSSSTSATTTKTSTPAPSFPQGQPIQTYTQSSGVSTPQTMGSSIPTYTQSQPVTQSIPTFEDPRDGYSGGGAGGAGGYSSIPVDGRSVRPSEMKDEGRLLHKFGGEEAEANVEGVFHTTSSRTAGLGQGFISLPRCTEGRQAFPCSRN